MNKIDMRNHMSDPGYTMHGTCSNCLSHSLVTYETGKERRTMLKCPGCEGLHKFVLQPYTSPQSLQGVKCVCGGELTRLDDEFLMCVTCNEAKVKIVNQVSELENERAEMLEALKLAYRKHSMGDESVGWEELSERLLDTLCNVVGPQEYIKWANEIREKMG